MTERGTIVSLSVKGPSTSKPRPWVVLQSDHFLHTNSITVCPFTHVILPEAPLLRIDVAASAVNGLEVRSQIQVDKISTVRRIDISRDIGRLEDRYMRALEEAVRCFLGLDE